MPFGTGARLHKTLPDVSTPHVLADLEAGVASDAEVAAITTNPQKADHVSTSYTLGAAAEAEVTSLAGNGLANIIFDGNGDGVFNIRVYSDGMLEDEFPTNWSGKGAYALTTSLSVRVHNPTAATATQTSTSFKIRAIMR